jgi:hypothetical protein
VCDACGGHAPTHPTCTHAHTHVSTPPHPDARAHTHTPTDRGVAQFEQFLAEHDLVSDVTFDALSQLYADPNNLEVRATAAAGSYGRESHGDMTACAGHVTSTLATCACTAVCHSVPGCRLTAA